MRDERGPRARFQAASSGSNPNSISSMPSAKLVTPLEAPAAGRSSGGGRRGRAVGTALLAAVVAVAHSGLLSTPQTHCMIGTVHPVPAPNLKTDDGSATEAGVGAGAGAKPHLVFLLGDEIGWNNVGWHSNITLSPNLDELAKTGLTLNRHYVQRWCAATRTALLTGRFPYNTGLMRYNHGVEEERSAVPTAFAMLPKLLKTAGYKSHMLGKWHLGFFTQVPPVTQCATNLCHQSPSVQPTCATSHPVCNPGTHARRPRVRKQLRVLLRRLHARHARLA